MRNNQKYTQEKMYAAIERCHKDGYTYSQHCRQADIHYATFKYWVKKYQRQHVNREATLEASFLPVHLETEIHSTDRFTITYPGGIRIDCPATTPVGYLSALLKSQ